MRGTADGIVGPPPRGQWLETGAALLLAVLWVLPLVYAFWAAFHPPHYATRFEPHVHAQQRADGTRALDLASGDSGGFVDSEGASPPSDGWRDLAARARPASPQDRSGGKAAARKREVGQAGSVTGGAR